MFIRISHDTFNNAYNLSLTLLLLQFLVEPNKRSIFNIRYVSVMYLTLSLNFDINFQRKNGTIKIDGS